VLVGLLVCCSELMELMERIKFKQSCEGAEEKHGKTTKILTGYVPNARRIKL